MRDRLTINCKYAVQTYTACMIFNPGMPHVITWYARFNLAEQICIMHACWNMERHDLVGKTVYQRENWRSSRNLFERTSKQAIIHYTLTFYTSSEGAGSAAYQLDWLWCFGPVHRLGRLLANLLTNARRRICGYWPHPGEVLLFFLSVRTLRASPVLLFAGDKRHTPTRRSWQHESLVWQVSWNNTSLQSDCADDDFEISRTTSASQ